MERTEPVPYVLAADLRSAHGTDVGGVPVHRGPRADRDAERLAARAYTEDGDVFLPTGAGELTAPEGRALLAHELVHAVQQRELGDRLPAESTADGARLEADALATEAAVRAGRPLPPLRHRSPATDSPPTDPPSDNPPATDRPVTVPVGRPAASRPVVGRPGPVPGRIQRAGPPTTLVHPPAANRAAGSGPAAGVPATGVSASPGSPPQPAATQTAAAQTAAAQTAAAQAAAAAQAGSQTDRRDEANPRTWREFGQAMRASAGAAVLDMWAIDPEVQREALGLPAPDGGSRLGSSRPGATGTPAGAGAAPFDRARRREELQRQALALLNTDVQGGQLEITELTVSQREQIERQLDAEAVAAGHRGVGSQQGADGDPDRVRTWGEFAGELRYGLAELATSPWGIDFTADEIRELRGRQAGTGTAGQQVGHPSHATGTAAGAAGRPLIDADHLDLDDVAGRLYDRLRSRLRLELLLDRERAGLLTDFR